MTAQPWRLAIVATFLTLIHVAGAQVRTDHPSREQVSADIEISIRDASSYYSVDPALIRAVIQQESGYNPWAISSKGAMGLMQLMPKTAWSLGVTNPFNPRQNVFAGTLYLRQLLDEHGSANLALAAYNAGDKAVHAYRGVPPYAETVQYINRIAYLYRAHRFGALQKMTQSIAVATLGDHHPTL